MKIEILKMGKMQETGESLLQLIQNNTLPTLDIFLREVIQNSLDASTHEKDFVRMSFNTGEFNRDEFSNFTPEISNSLSAKYKSRCKFLSVSDKNTVGLTGPIHQNEMEQQYGNLLKLVYNISKKQEQDGSGGSWGLGKTVYFRMGIGLVAYYSRIKENGKYSSRLVITLIENEKKENTLIDKNNHSHYTGVAWWGEHYKNTLESCPLTDEREIVDFLNVFGIKPYTGDDTGTVVIIPFVDEKKLLKDAKGIVVHEDTKDQIPWLNSVEEYLITAIQRWYAPRINNKNYCKIYPDNSYLRVSVNERILNQDNGHKIFEIIRELYNENELYFDTFSNKPNFQEIKLKNEFEGSQAAGKICFIKIDKRDAGMYEPTYEPNPYLFCNEYDKHDSNPPIICFVRKPGMIVNYDIRGSWANRIVTTDEDHYIVAVFKPNSSQKLKDSCVVRDKQVTDLESYLRQIEYGDHTTWEDTSGKKIVSKIQGHIRKYINDKYDEKKERKDLPTSNLVGRQIADFLMPKTGFGHSAHRGGQLIPPKPPTLKSKTGKPKFSITNQAFDEEKMIIDFVMYGGKKTPIMYLEIGVDSETGFIEAEKWEEDLEETLPIEIEKLIVKEVKNERNQTIYSEFETIYFESNEGKEIFDIEFIPISTRKGSKSKIRIIKQENKEIFIEGQLFLKFMNNNLQAIVKAKGEK